jgi:type IV secretory pathway VirB10-like protein
MTYAQWVGIAFVAMVLPATAATYKWVDADGNVHYSDQPGPAGVKELKLQTTSKPAPPPAPAAEPAGKAGAQPAKTAKTPAEQEMEFRKRRVEAAEAEAKRQKDAEANADKQRNCEQARNRVAQLQAGGRIGKSAPNGEMVYLSDAEIGQELVQARKTADSWCK